MSEDEIKDEDTLHDKLHIDDLTALTKHSWADCNEVCHHVDEEYDLHNAESDLLGSPLTVEANMVFWVAY